MNFTNIATLATGICCCFQLMAGDEISFAKPEAWQQPDAIKVSGSSLLISGKTMLIGKKLIKLPKGGDLKITGTFRAEEGTANNTVYIGFRTYDKNRKEIRHHNIRPIAGTDTVLTADAKAGDTSITVADASRWTKNSIAVFGTKPDYGDLPNYNVLPGISSVEKSGNGWKVTFTSALKGDLAKGIGVRTHADGGYMYYTFIDTKPGTTNPPRNVEKKIWPGVAYVRFMVLVNWKGGKNSRFEMINPCVTVIDPAVK